MAEAEYHSTDILKRINPDASEAEQQLSLIRRKLLDFFRWNLAASPEDLAQETLTRVALRVRDPSANIHVPIKNYCFGVARLVLMEARRIGPETPVDPDELDSLRQAAAARPVTPDQEFEFKELLAECLRFLPHEDLDLLCEYESTAGSQLARKLAITEEALRTRVFRMRQKLRNGLAEKFHGAAKRKARNRHY